MILLQVHIFMFKWFFPNQKCILFKSDTFISSQTQRKQIVDKLFDRVIKYFISLRSITFLPVNGKLCKQVTVFLRVFWTTVIVVVTISSSSKLWQITTFFIDCQWTGDFMSKRILYSNIQCRTLVKYSKPCAIAHSKM